MHSTAPCLHSTPGSVCFSVSDYSYCCACLAQAMHCDIAVERSTVIMVLKYCTLTFLLPVKSQLMSPGPLPNATPAILLPGEEGPGARLGYSSLLKWTLFGWSIPIMSIFGWPIPIMSIFGWPIPIMSNFLDGQLPIWEFLDGLFQLWAFFGCTIPIMSIFWMANSHYEHFLDGQFQLWHCWVILWLK